MSCGGALVPGLPPLLGTLSPSSKTQHSGVMGRWHSEVTGVQSLSQTPSCGSNTLPTSRNSNKLNWPSQSLPCPPSAPGWRRPRPLGAVHGTSGALSPSRLWCLVPLI